jgi:hypothetical protein
MANTLTVLWWRDIPSQVIVGQGRGAARVALTDRFQMTIDRAAARAGLQGSDGYLEQWRRASRPCGEDLAAEAAAEAARLELEYTEDRLKRLETAGGLETAAGATETAAGTTATAAATAAATATTATSGNNASAIRPDPSAGGTA